MEKGSSVTHPKPIPFVRQLSNVKFKGERILYELSLQETYAAYSGNSGHGEVRQVWSIVESGFGEDNVSILINLFFYPRLCHRSCFWTRTTVGLEIGKLWNADPIKYCIHFESNTIVSPTFHDCVHTHSAFPVAKGMDCPETSFYLPGPDARNPFSPAGQHEDAQCIYEMVSSYLGANAFGL